uniref:Mitochondrial inner membrane protease subunit 2 n=1 Tax=Equus caballus TaxID=9796 RepID=A0A9L0SX62_HORSE
MWEIKFLKRVGLIRLISCIMSWSVFSHNHLDPNIRTLALRDTIIFVFQILINIVDSTKEKRKLRFGEVGSLLQSQRSPKNPEQKIIKRVIALEGDIVKTIGHKNRYVKVPRGHIWVEGDHHGHSFDSNSFGPVSLGLLHAHATHILWPPERWQKLESVLPPERLPVQSEKESLHGSP